MTGIENSEMVKILLGVFPAHSGSNSQNTLKKQYIFNAKNPLNLQIWSTNTSNQTIEWLCLSTWSDFIRGSKIKKKQSKNQKKFLNDKEIAWSIKMYVFLNAELNDTNPRSKWLTICEVFGPLNDVWSNGSTKSINSLVRCIYGPIL